MIKLKIIGYDIARNFGTNFENNFRIFVQLLYKYYGAVFKTEDLLT